MPHAFVLSENDATILKAVIDRERNLVQSTRNRAAVNPKNDPTVETYLARTPQNGLPAMSAGAMLGTSSAQSLDDVPGSANCSVFQTVDGVPLSAGFTVTVYNYSLSKVPPGLWMIIGRDKFGTWYPTHIFWEIGECGAGSGNLIIGDGVTGGTNQSILIVSPTGVLSQLAIGDNGFFLGVDSGALEYQEFNTVDVSNFTLSVADPTDWNVTPTNIKQAVDELAQRVKDGGL